MENAKAGLIAEAAVNLQELHRRLKHIPWKVYVVNRPDVAQPGLFRLDPSYVFATSLRESGHACLSSFLTIWGRASCEDFARVLNQPKRVRKQDARLPAALLDSRPRT